MISKIVMTREHFGLDDAPFGIGFNGTFAAARSIFLPICALICSPWYSRNKRPQNRHQGHHHYQPSVPMQMTAREPSYIAGTFVEKNKNAEALKKKHDYSQGL
jgi:hypothetical protein